MTNLDPLILKELQAFAKEEGRNWKEWLRSYWYKGLPVPGYPLLYALRNHPSYGPSWLDKFKLPK